MSIMVLNIPRNVKSEAVKALFEPFGAVASVELVMDKETGASKGFGFVEMEDDAHVDAAIAGVHGAQVGNQVVRVKFSEKKA